MKHPRIALCSRNVRLLKGLARWAQLGNSRLPRRKSGGMESAAHLIGVYPLDARSEGQYGGIQGGRSKDNLALRLKHLVLTSFCMRDMFFWERSRSW
jgi:hypothetical protein